MKRLYFLLRAGRLGLLFVFLGSIHVDAAAYSERTPMGSATMRGSDPVAFKNNEMDVHAASLQTRADFEVRGRVVSDSGTPLAGATVAVLASDGRSGDLKTTTDDAGIFRLANVPNDAILEVTYVGFEPKVVQAAADLGDVILKPSYSELDEVVVTGVAAATSRARLPFALSKVERDSIGALDLTQTLRGRVAGLQVSQAEGDNGASVVLRGAKSLGGNISPLLVIDGFVTNLSLSEINPLDVESIEVVKGAAASALYGTRAEGGVIQVITKTGRGIEDGFRVILDNEYGLNNIQHYPELTDLHPYQIDMDDEFGFEYAPGSTTARMLDYKENGFSVNLNPYKNYYNNTEALLNNNEFYRNYISLATSGSKYNAYVSFENQVVGGVVDVVPANKRQSAKLNLQLRPFDRLDIDVNLQYYHTEKPSVAVRGGGYNTFFGSTLLYEPFIDLSAKNESGGYNFKPHGFDVQSINLENPLYEWDKREYRNSGDDILAGGKLKYRFLENLSLEVLGSISKRFRNLSNLYPKGFERVSPSAKTSNGYLELYRSEATQYNGQSMLSYQDIFGDFTFGANLKMAYEYDFGNWVRTVGYDFSSPLYTIQNAQVIDRDSGTTGGSGDFSSKTVNYGWFLNLNTSYQDKLFLDVLGRIDQSSRYGVDAQNAFFPRISAAYRITEDYDLGAINELKARLSYGKAGRLPGYGYKESVAVVSNTGISITQNANTNLSRSITSEWEMGLDAQVWRTLNIQLTYATAKSSGDFVRPPVFTPYMGVTPAYQNFGLISSNSIELEAHSNIINTPRFSWDAHLTFSRTRSMIEALGQGLPPYISGLYRKEPGVSPFAFYGQNVLRSLDELETVDGMVVNAAGGTQPLENFAVNSLGYVVLKSTMGTEDEVPLLLEEDGSTKNTVMGDAQPNFIVGFGSSLTFFKNLSFSLNMDWKNGGQKYNKTVQYLTFQQRSRIWEDYAQTGIPLAFIQGLYNGSQNTNIWVENSSYVSLREVALGYSIPMPKRMGWFKSARIGVVGRNLYTWTNFTGTNPEGQAEYAPYPIYRTFTGKLTLTF